jgi:Trk K+ transport system NAD-binding subunit
MSSMRVIVCGAGQVGSTIARHLATERVDVTVLDTSPEARGGSTRATTCAAWSATPPIRRRWSEPARGTPTC